MSLLSEDFKEGFRDGTGQCASNIESALIDCIDKGKIITKELAIDICETMRNADEEYLNQ